MFKREAKRVMQNMSWFQLCASIISSTLNNHVTVPLQLQIALYDKRQIWLCCKL